MFLAVVVVACVTRCADAELLTPGGKAPGIAIAPVVTDSACRTILFTMSPLSATFPSQGSCGSGLTEITPTGAIVGTMTTARRVYFRIRIKNRSTVPVTLPLRLVLPRSGIVVLSDGNVSQVTAFNPDTLRSDSTAVWLAGGTGTLAVGDSTPVLEPIFKVDLPVNQVRLNFQVLGEGIDVVPAVAPDSTPAWFGNDSSWIGGTLKRVIIVRFKPGTTPSNKKAALDSVGAVVVGGSRWPEGTDGYYYLFVSGASTSALLGSAADVLNRQSVVEYASPYFSVVPLWVRPNDGVGWTSAMWHVDPDSSSGDKWWLEEVGAPYAWGCESDASIASITVVEKAFRGGKFQSNISGGLPQREAHDTHDLAGHGAFVATVLADAGNDGSAGTGILWRANFRPVAIGIHSGMLELGRAIHSAAQGGAKVINVSLGAGLDTIPSDDLRRVEAFRTYLYNSLDYLTQPQRPLVVVAAGNDQRDVNEAGLDSVRTAFPDNVLVVAASRRRSGTVRDRWGGGNSTKAKEGGSNFGSLVDVYAPGEGVTAWDDSLQTFVERNGSSFAAPIITGIAGLMLASDSTLTPAEIKQIILVAASERGVSILHHPGKYLADAYGALRKVAERRGADLCGNRVWVQGLRSIVIQRGDARDTVYTLPPPDTLGVMFTRHGGRRIDFNVKSSGSNYWGLDHVWSGAGRVWSKTGSAFPFPINQLSGTTSSFFGDTHDGDSTVRASRTVFGGAEGETVALFDVALHDRFLGGSRPLVQGMSRPLLAANFVTGRQNGQTDSTGHFTGYSQVPSFRVPNSDFETATVRVLPSPLGDRVLVVFNYFMTTVSGGHWAPGSSATPLGAEWSYQEWMTDWHTTSEKVEVFNVPWVGGSPPSQPTWAKSNLTIGWMGLSEGPGSIGAQEAVMGIGRVDYSAAQPFVNGYVDCKVEYATASTGAVNLTRTAAPVTCGVGQIEIGTIAPIRRPLIPPQPTQPKAPKGPVAKLRAVP